MTVDLSQGTALITGASSGLGEEMARQLAGRGMSLILVARRDSALQALAAELRQTHNVDVDVLACDLTSPQAVREIEQALSASARTVDLLVNNAGFGTTGAFSTLSPAREQQEITLNVATIVALSHLLLPGMLERGQGGIINVASMAAFQPTPYMSVYGATKAFVLSFSEGLAAECRGSGVHVLALCPGPVHTGFAVAAGKANLIEELPGGTVLTAERVVADGLRAYARGQSLVIPGRKNWWLAFVNRLLPRAFVAGMAARMMRPARP